jgi:hypothetical protein
MVSGMAPKRVSWSWLIGQARGYSSVHASREEARAFARLWASEREAEGYSGAGSVTTRPCSQPDGRVVLIFSDCFDCMMTALAASLRQAQGGAQLRDVELLPPPPQGEKVLN